MRTKRSRKHIADVAKKHNISFDQAEEIVETFFRFTADVMKEGNKKTLDFADVRLIKWGVFKVKPGRKQHFKRLRDEKSDTNSE